MTNNTNGKTTATPKAPNHRGWYATVFSNWQTKQLGAQPTNEQLGIIHALGARPGKQAMANAMALRDQGVTGNQIKAAASLFDGNPTPQLNKMRGFITDALVKRLPAGKRNGLRDLLGACKAPFLDHDPRVGGRFSVLTNVGLVPAAVAGLDVAAVRAGAAAALAPVLAGKPPGDIPACVGAALAVTLGATKGKTISVLMAYADRLERLTRWYVQLWGESLGKDRKGTTSIGALGPVDQHSQLQLYIAGPRDKLFTVVTVGAAGRGPRMDAKLAALAGEPDFAGKTIGDLVAAQGRATAETLIENGCLVRTIHLAWLDEQSLGELLMHFMLETIVAAHLLGVDPFDQPAVEEGKVLPKTYLAGGA